MIGARRTSFCLTSSRTMAPPLLIPRIVSLAILCSLIFPSSAAAASSATDEYTESEIEFGHSLDWCVGDDAHPIRWFARDEVAVDAKIAAGARPAPDRDAKGRIVDLEGFVADRLSTLPPEAVRDNLPSIVIENECASVTRGSDKCVFDYAATPAPFQWASTEYFTMENLWSVSPSIQNWSEDDLTVVYAPVSKSSDGAKELTRLTSKQPKLANLHTRGNSSRKVPKKQFSLKLPISETLIPGGAKAKKWVLSAYSSGFAPDQSYIDNKLVFDMYQKFGQVQKDFSGDWPEEGSVEDLATRAYAPRSQMVNLIFQGRYAGIYYLMDRVEAREGRVWLPEAGFNVLHEPTQVDGIELPRGNYLLSRDWTSNFKSLLNPDRPSATEDANSEPGYLLVPNYHNWSDVVVDLMIGSRANYSDTTVTTHMEWTIMYPKNKSFADSEKDEDVSLLKGFLLQLHKWLEDPYGNNDILSNVIDMTSMARWFLLQEVAKEHDGYVASMYFKVVGGKLYHASPWDYAGTSFRTHKCDEPNVYNPLTINRETNRYSTRPQCDVTTGNIATAGWWVDSIYGMEEGLCTKLSGEEGVKYGVDCSEGKDTLLDFKWFFGNIFYTPALQEEFWKLWDIVVEHGLVGTNRSGSGDLFSMDLFADEIFEPIRETVEADRRIWSATLQNQNVTFDTSSIHPGSCEPLLEESLRESNAGNISFPDPFTIPSENWAFQTAAKNGEFINFYKALVADQPIDAVSDYVDSDYVFVKRANYFKYRLKWIMSQHPGNTEVDVDETSMSLSDSQASHSMLITAIVAAVVIAVLIFAKLFRKNGRSTYSAVDNVELE
ncbi:hypothetical protein ACHAWF_014627 [Thalassiosira exigua]